MFCRLQARVLMFNRLHTCQLSRFRGFLPITRSQRKISRYHDLAQDFLNLKINQFFEKLINFVCEFFFFLFGKRKNTLRPLLRLILYFSRVVI